MAPSLLRALLLLLLRPRPVPVLLRLRHLVRVLLHLPPPLLPLLPLVPPPQQPSRTLVAEQPLTKEQAKVLA